MAIKRKRFVKGIELSPEDLTLEALSREGELAYDSSDDKLKYRDSSVTREVVNTDEAQSLENKTIDATAATGNNTLSADSADIVYDDTANAVSSLGTDVQAALDAIKTALDNQNEASEIQYTPAVPADYDVAPSFVKPALDELASRVRTNEGDISTNATGLSDHLADAVDAHDASAISVVPSGNQSSTDAQSAIDELQSDIDTRALANSGTISNATITTPAQLDVKQDTEANLVTYASTASDGQIVFATDSQKMFQIIDNELQPIGGGGSTQFEIEQVGHGFSVGDGIYHDSSQPVGSEWQLAQADNADTLAYHVVIERIDDDNFIAADFGRVEVPSHGFTVGQYYFLSDSVAGQPTTTEPSSFSNPLFYVETADILQIKCLRPEQVGADTNLDDLSDVSVSAPSDGEALVYNNSTGLWEAQTITAAPTPVALDDLTDVDATTPSDGDTLVYNSGSGNYELQPTATQNVNIAALNIDWSSNAVYYKDISADTTFTFSNDTDGQTIIVILNNTDVNPHAITFPSGVLVDPNYDGNVEATTESVFTFVKSNGKIYLSEVKELS